MQVIKGVFPGKKRIRSFIVWILILLGWDLTCGLYTGKDWTWAILGCVYISYIGVKSIT